MLAAIKELIKSKLKEILMVNVPLQPAKKFKWKVAIIVMIYFGIMTIFALEITHLLVPNSYTIGVYMILFITFAPIIMLEKLGFFKKFKLI